MKKPLCVISVLCILSQACLAGQMLSQKDFIESAVKNHPKYQISAKDYLIALNKNASTQSIKDWNLIASGIYSESYPAPISSFSSEYQKAQGYSVGIEKYFVESGTALSLKHSNTRIDATYPPPMEIPGIGTMDFNPPSKYYLADLSLTITQPLLKNAFGLQAKNALKMSDHSLALARIKLSEDWEDFIKTLKDEYATWQKCQRNVDIFEDKVEAVEDQLKLVEKQRKYGLSEELDLVQIKQKVEAYRILLEQARMACDNQSRKITSYAGLKETSPGSISPEAFRQSFTALDQKEALAYLNSSSNLYKTADLMVDLQKTGLETKENALLMDLNLMLQTRPNSFSEGFSDSLSGIGEYKENTISLNAGRTLFNQKAEAEAKEAKDQLEKAQKQKEEILLNSNLALSSLYASLDHLERMIILNQNNLALAKQRYSLEKKKFDQGRSSIFFVLQAEDDSLQAESALNELLFAREAVVNQINSFTDRYSEEYKGILRIEK